MKSAIEAAIIAGLSAALAFNYDRQEMPDLAVAWSVCAISWGISAIIRTLKA